MTNDEKARQADEAERAIERYQERIAFSSAQDEPYDAAADFSRSLDDCYTAIRERVAAGGEGWEPR